MPALAALVAVTLVHLVAQGVAPGGMERGGVRSFIVTAPSGAPGR